MLRETKDGIDIGQHMREKERKRAQGKHHCEPKSERETDVSDRWEGHHHLAIKS